MTRVISVYGMGLPVFRSLVGGAVLVCCCLVGNVPDATAGKPEYMKLKLQVGVTLEIKGHVNKDGVFVATDLQELAKPRRPKLRGTVEAVDHKNKVIQIFGVQIDIRSETESGDASGGRFEFKTLKVGDRVEVSCRVKEGRWIAREIKRSTVKKSDKIKGTLSRVHVDGEPPDTLDISGLLIVVDEQTDVDDEEEHSLRMENILFGDLARTNAMDHKHGIPMANGMLLLGAEYRHNLRSESDFDLSQTFMSDVDNTQPELRVEASGYWTDQFRTFAQFRVRKKYILTSDSLQPSNRAEAHFTQLYALAPNIGGSGFALQVGRQDFDEPREWLFDEYLDAARAYYHGANPLVVEAAVIDAVNPIKEKFETWTDFFAMARWFIDKHSQVGAYLLLRQDTSLRNREPVWWGLRAVGKGRFVSPWAEFAIQRGEDKGENVEASAIDIGGTLRLADAPGLPSLTLGYAAATGDETGADRIDRTFRQTGYQDNVAQLGGVTSVKYYGAVLDPELSNLVIWTVGAGIEPFPKTSVEVIYHKYRQDQPDDKIRGGELVNPPAGPNGVSDDIGWGLDVVVGLPELWDHVRLSWTFGYFNPGAAFDPQEDAFLSKINLRIEL